MQLILRNATNKYDVRFQSGQIIDVNGVIFKVASVNLQTKKMELEPAAIDDVRIHMQKTTQADVSAPKLSGGPVKVEAPQLEAPTPVDPKPAEEQPSE